MQHGGRRPGAGRPRGAKNRRTQMLEEGNRLASKGGLSPLEHLLLVMRDERRPFRQRIEAAKAAAPYCHPKLSVQHVRLNSDQHMSHAEWVKYMIEEGPSH